ncbi:MAG TPA: hypothetical protein PK858_10945, partial [Saprospiraceae bacterium]|nr:hypothetical protein [Saprospiraceae bacterium]
PPAANSNPTVGVKIEFSTAAARTGDAPDNWCRARFDQAQVLYPDPANADRRYFILPEGMCRVAVDLGTTTTSFLIRKKSADAVELLSSDQQPECLSNRANFSLENGGTRLRYDNHRYINFQVAPEAVPGGLRLWIEMPAGAGYGLLVHKAEL